MVNYMSALMSGACILFLFWSITHLVRKLVVTDENNITRGQMVTIMGSGLVGALAYTFSDTFWFSAVEGGGVCLLLTVHCRRILAHTEVGRRRQRASQ